MFQHLSLSRGEIKRNECNQASSSELELMFRNQQRQYKCFAQDNISHRFNRSYKLFTWFYSQMSICSHLNREFRRFSMILLYISHKNSCFYASLIYCYGESEHSALWSINGVLDLLLTCQALSVMLGELLNNYASTWRFRSVFLNNQWNTREK